MSDEKVGWILKDQSASTWRNPSNALCRIDRVAASTPQPVIAAVRGYCLGGGFELALYCDLRVAAPNAVFSFPEMTLGAYPGTGAAVVIPRLIGRGRAKEIFFTARQVNADEALSLGIVEWVVPHEQVVNKTLEIAESMKKCSPLGIARVKQMVNFGTDLEFEKANALNEKLRRPLEGSEDYLEGITAFFEKRPHDMSADDNALGVYRTRIGHDDRGIGLYGRERP